MALLCRRAVVLNSTQRLAQVHTLQLLSSKPVLNQELHLKQKLNRKKVFELQIGLPPEF